MSELALEHIRVVDFTWVISGPYAAKMLADQGAEVIKIETDIALRAFRMSPSVDMNVPTPQLDRGAAFDLLNRNKKSITLNLKTPQAVEILKQLVSVSDVVMENFSAKGMKSLGLDYVTLRKVNPRIIMISMAGLGHSGPFKDYITHGNTLQAMYGLNELTGYADGYPVGPGFTYSDYAGGVHAALAVLAALRYRSVTGHGQYIDLGQYDLGASLMGLSLLDYTANGRIQQRAGNRSEQAAPYGCYRCKGEERWCTIAVRSDRDWQSFTQALGSPAWAYDAKFNTLIDRLRHADELDKLVEDWTIAHSPEEVMERLQSAGVEAGIVQNTEDLVNHDRQLRERGLYVEVPHQTRDLVFLEGVPYKASRTPGSLRQAGPFPGEHNDFVYGEVLGLSHAEIENYTESGVFR